MAKFKQDLDARQGRREARAAEELRRAEQDTLRMLELEAAGQGPSADELMVYLFTLNPHTTEPCMTAQLVYDHSLLCFQTCSQFLSPYQTCFDLLPEDCKDLPHCCALRSYKFIEEVDQEMPVTPCWIRERYGCAFG